MSAQASLWVRYNGPEADPDRTRKANPGSGWSPLSVRLGLVGTVYSRKSVLFNYDFMSFYWSSSNKLFNIRRTKITINPTFISDVLKCFSVR